jgi:hypothetical protein
MLTIDTICNCRARCIGLNYGADDRGVIPDGHVYQIVEEHRIQFVDKSSSSKREWRLDGRAMGEDMEGLNLALAGLAQPPEIGSSEALALQLVPDRWEPLRSVRDRVAFAMTYGRTLAVQDTIKEVQMRAYFALSSLDAKGLVEIGRKFRDLDRSTNPNSWYPTVRRRQP